MGKVKKTVKDNAKKSKYRRVLRVKTTSKSTRNTRKNLGAISRNSVKSSKKLTDVDTKLIKPVKRSIASTSANKKPQNTKRNSISNVKKTVTTKNQGKSKKSTPAERKRSKTRSELKRNTKSASPKIKKSKVVTMKNKSSDVKSKKTNTLRKNKKQDTVDQASRFKAKITAKNKSSSQVKRNVSLITKNNIKTTDVKTKKSSVNGGKENKNTAAITKIVTSKDKFQKFKVNTALIFKPKHRSDVIVPNIEESTARSAVNVLIKNSKSSFEDESSIFLHFSCVKTRETPCQTLCIPLKHSLVRETGEVCLIVKTMNENQEEYQQTIEHYENILKETNIKTIITYYQLRTNCADFELQRKFVKSYDVILVDDRVYDYVLMTLRKIVYDVNKLPIPVKLDSEPFKEQVDAALLKTPIYLFPSIENFAFRIGHLEMTENQVCENVFEACRNLSKKFPGGWNNITGAGIKMSGSTSIPILDMSDNPPKATVPALKDKYDVEINDGAPEEVTVDEPESMQWNEGTDRSRYCKDTENGESDGFAGFAPED